MIAHIEQESVSITVQSMLASTALLGYFAVVKTVPEYWWGQATQPVSHEGVLQWAVVHTAVDSGIQLLVGNVCSNIISIYIRG